MKKSATILLSVTLALAACRNEEVSDDWVSGSDDPNTRDTVVQGQSYRYYHGSYFPIFYGMISPSSYRGASINDISRPGFTPSKVTRGGFGSRSRATS